MGCPVQSRGRAGEAVISSVEEWARGAKRMLLRQLSVLAFLAFYTTFSLVTSLLLASLFLVPAFLSQGTVLFRFIMDKVLPVTLLCMLFLFPLWCLCLCVPRSCCCLLPVSCCVRACVCVC